MKNLDVRNTMVVKVMAGWIFRECSGQPSRPVYDVIKSTLNGEVPVDWKQLYLVPTYKGGDK